MSRGPAHETRTEHDGDGERSRARAGGGSEGAAFEGTVSTLSPAGVSRVQRAAGNHAVSHALRAERLAVQRHPEGTELPTKDEDVTEVQHAATAETSTGQAPPTGGTTTATETPGSPEEPTHEPTTQNDPSAATRTKQEEKKEKKEGSEAGSAFKKAQKNKLTKGAMSLAGAQSILQGAFGDVKKIVTGTIVILADQPACSAKYDEVQIRRGVKRPDGSDWKMGDCAKDDAAEGVLTEGFADTDTNTIYVNGKTDLVTATAHEMLHTNTVAGFRGKVGETFNEGATEYLARKALKASGVPVPGTTAYPEQVKLTKKLVAFVGEDNLIAGYFSNPDTLVNAFTAKSATSWADLKTAAEALDEGKVKKALKKKNK